MTSPDDFGLTRLFLPRPVGAATATPLGATLVTWNPITYQNTVIIGSTTYTDLPVLNPTSLTTGPVMVQKTASGWVVVGMITAAGGQLVDLLRYRDLTANVSNATTTFADVSTFAFPFVPYTSYCLDGVLFYSVPAASDIKFAWSGPPSMDAKWSMYGVPASVATTAGSIETAAINGYGDGAAQVVGGESTLQSCRPMGGFSTGDTGGVLQLRMACNASTGPAVVYARSWLRCAELGVGVGGAGATPPPATYTKTYICTASRSYDTDGNPVSTPDGNNNVYQGIFSSRGNGNEKAMIIFPGATMRADMAGATVLTAKLWLYCFMSGDSTGSFTGKTEPNTSVPATYNPSGTQITSNHNWPIPGWASVSAVSFINQILAGDNAVGLLERLISGYETGFRGYGFSSTYRPYFEVSYEA